MVWRWLRRLFVPPSPPAAFSAREGEALPDCRTAVRAAGPEAMRDTPRRWDVVDQQVDESFPASDPPGGY
jgi:hypothetical protein